MSSDTGVLAAYGRAYAGHGKQTNGYLIESSGKGRDTIDSTISIYSLWTQAPALGASFMGNLYITPSNSRGFKPHTDNKDGLVMQLAGRKRWHIWATNVSNPNRNMMHGRYVSTSTIGCFSTVNNFPGRMNSQ